MTLDEIFILKFVKFCVVGLSGMVIDFGVTWSLKEKIKINAYLANSCGFILAASSNYILNRIWAFESHNEAIVIEYISFFTIALVGLGLNNLILWLFTSKLKINFYLSKLFAIGFVTLWNFGMNFVFTF
jgi:putative flippase GtrA